MDCSTPGSSSVAFSRQEYWSELPCPPAQDLPDPGIEPVMYLFQMDIFEMDASTIKSLVSGTTFTIRKANDQAQGWVDSWMGSYMTG